MQWAIMREMAQAERSRLRQHAGTLVLMLVLVATSAAQLQGGYIGNGISGAGATGEKVTLSGTVVNAITNEPIAHAVVSIFADRQRAVFTDRDGHFSFGTVNAGNYLLQAHKPGYLSEQELGAQPRIIGGVAGYEQTLGTPAMESDSGAVVKLWPMGKIRVHVVDGTGEPLEGAQVEAVGDAIQNGRKQHVNVQQATTDDDGNAVVGRLRPGTYRIGVVPQQRIVSRQNGVTIAYAGKTYYPDAREPDGAAPLEMAAGQIREIEIGVTPQPVFRIAGTVQPPGISGLQVKIGEDFANAFVQVDRNSGRFVIPQIPAGRYTLEATDNNPPNGLMHAESTIVVDKDMEGVVVPVQAALTILVEVRTEFSGKEPPLASSGPISYVGPATVRRDVPLSMYLHPVQRDRSYYSSLQRKDDGALFMKDVLPGRYHVEFAPSGGAYVYSATHAGRDLLRDELVADGSTASQPIEITLRNDFAWLSVEPPEKDRPIFLFAVPENGPANVIPLGTVVGATTSMQLPPATYDIFAFDDPTGVAWAEPEGLDAYRKNAARITLGPDEHATVTPQLIQRETK